MAKRRSLAAPAAVLESEPDLPDPIKNVIEAAVAWAWGQVKERWPATVATGREEEITERLCFVLNEQGPDDGRIAPGLNSFETVARGAKTLTSDGRIEKAPDLVVRPIAAIGVRNRGFWGLFIECKIIADESHHSAKAYCVNGVARFVSGEYAARMPSGMMVAYVRNGARPYATLSPLLTEYETISHTSGALSQRSSSAHRRSARPSPCTDVTLVHLWLDAA
jgi:hypothetical protein